MLFIDQPIGTGFSYAKDESEFVRTNEDAAFQFRIFLTNFFSIFTDYKANPIYLNGASYCGKFLPLMAKQILAHSEDEINLQALMLGNGLIDPITQRLAIPNLIQSLGFSSFNEQSQANLLQTKCKRAFVTNKTEATEVCNRIPKYFYELSAHVDLYNLENFEVLETEPYEEYLAGNYATNISEVLHVSQTPKLPIYSSHNSKVASALNSVFMDSAVQTYNQLLAAKLPMLLYVGQFDGYDGVTGQLEVLELFDWEMKHEFNHQPRLIYVTDNFKHAGYFQQVTNFTWAIVSRAGHAAPMDQPQNTLSLIRDFISNGMQLPSREGSTAPQKAMCEFMNYCSGQGVCDERTGTCSCNQGFIGKDCSEELKIFDSQAIQLNLGPQEWYYFRAKYAQNYHTTIKSKNDIRFSVLGLDQDDSQLPSFEYHDLKETAVLHYTHYVQFESDKTGENYDLIGIYNPYFTSTAQILISYEQIFESGETEVTKSFWSPPNGGFWIEVVILVVSIVSIVFNIVLYKKFARIQKRSYSFVDLKKSGRIDEISTVFKKESVCNRLINEMKDN